MDWQGFVKDFVAGVDYDISKQLEAGTAEIPEEAEEFLAELVIMAENLYKKYKGEQK